MASPYRELFDEYVAELRAAKALAERWWATLVAAEARRGLPPADADARVRRRWPLGAPSHPRVIAVYRKYFLACEAITEQRLQGDDDGGEIVDAGSLVTEWLLDPATEDLVPFAGALPFAPIGMDEEGETV